MSNNLILIIIGSKVLGRASPKRLFILFMVILI